MDLTAGPTEVGIFVRRNESAGDGLRVAIKDILDRAGEVTTGGSRSLATSAAATQSSDVVLLLEQAGCSIVGRANMHELAYGVTGINHWSGTPTNPRYHRLIPGGSSSGSAVAVAAGLVDFSIGSDTGGSIRIPAACCGIVGLKPTFGRVSRRGAVPANTSLDCIGPFARDVEMIEIAMSIIDPSWARYDDRPHGRIAFVGGQAEETIDKIVRASAVAHFECVP